MTTIACQAVLDGSNILPEAAQWNRASTFGEGSGSVYLVEAEDCWQSVEAEINNSIALANDAISQLEALHMPTTVVDEALETIRSGLGYSDNLMTHTSWQWDQDTLEEGDVLGVCLYQAQESVETAASCWAYTFSQGEYKQTGDYLVQPSLIGGTTSVTDFESLDEAFTASVEGTWIFSAVETVFQNETNHFKRVSAARFNPKAEKEGANDYALQMGNVEVVTYIASRAATVVNAELYTVDHMLQQATDSFTANAKWQSEQVTIQCYNEVTCYVPPPPPEPVVPVDPVEPEEPTEPVAPTGAIATTVGAIIAASAVLAF